MPPEYKSDGGGVARWNEWYAHAFHDGHKARDIVAGVSSWVDIDLGLCIDQPVLCLILPRGGWGVCGLLPYLDHRVRLAMSGKRENAT
jgi:hypothetical protein